MSDIALRVEHISKRYRLGTLGSSTLSADLNRMFAGLRGKEDPSRKIGTGNSAGKSIDGDYVWSLQDVSFDIKKGDAVGIIGKNGAGKSTLLKLISRVTAPTSGIINIKGRVASLLEVGTGFHPELSGRDNIFMNGAILGMSRHEIRTKFDEIVTFSGVGKYIDTPVKRYSSGMYVRLAFAVAAHLESEILIVDEVLAVGDAEFQQKCLDKMQEINRKQHKTILFVTHNMALLNKLCNQGILLHQGGLKIYDTIGNVLNVYNQSNNVHSLFNTELNWPPFFFSERVNIKRFTISDVNENYSTTFFTRDSIRLNVDVSVNHTLRNARLVLFVYTADGTLAFMSALNQKQYSIDQPGHYSISCRIPGALLNEGYYDFYVQLGEPGLGIIIEKIFLTRIEAIMNGQNGSDFIEKWGGVVCPSLDWEIS
jgi:lipopolysaccharide transport system ATP-binding protein